MKTRYTVSTIATLSTVLLTACVGMPDSLEADESAGEVQSALTAWSPVTSLRLGGLSSETEVRSATDLAGNMIVVGTFAGSMTVGAGVAALTSAGGRDAFVAKLSPAGTVLWSRRLGSLGDDTASAVAVDGLNNVIVTGEMVGPVELGAGPVSGTGYILKLDSVGNHVWSKGFVRMYAGASTQPRDVAANATGTIVLGGVQSGAIDYGDGHVLSTGLDNSGPFVQSLAADGTFLWGYGGVTQLVADAEPVNGVAIDASGNVAVVGQHRFDLSMGCSTTSSSSYADMFVMKLTSTGACEWSALFGSTDGQLLSDRGIDVAFGARGAVLAAGSLDGAGNVGSVALPAGGDFVVSLTSTGAFSWARPFDLARIGSIATDSTGKLLVGGGFAGAVTLGGGNLVSAGGTDAFFARYSRTNAHLWSARYGNALDQSTVGATTAPNGDAIFVGSFKGTTSFGGAKLKSAGSTDLFVARFGMVTTP